MCGALDNVSNAANQIDGAPVNTFRGYLRFRRVVGARSHFLSELHVAFVFFFKKSNLVERLGSVRNVPLLCYIKRANS